MLCLKHSLRAHVPIAALPYKSVYSATRKVVKDAVIVCICMRLLLADGLMLNLMAWTALPAGAHSIICMSAHSINAATAVAERPAATTPVDTSKKPKELGFTMPGAPLTPCLLPTLLMLAMMHTYSSHEKSSTVTCMVWAPSSDILPCHL